MKNFNKTLSVFISLFTVVAFLFVNDFTKATYGWFRPSGDSVTFTLIGILVVSILFIFYGYRFYKISIFYIILSIILFIGYFGFLITTPSANMLEGPGFPLSLAYGIGKYGTFIVGVVILIRLLTSKRQDKQSQ